MPSRLHARLHYPASWAPHGLLHGRWFAPDRSNRVTYIGRHALDIHQARRAEDTHRWQHVAGW